MQLTAEMLREAFRQTQREILDLSASDQTKSERYHARWERMAELLNEKLAHEQARAGALELLVHEAIALLLAARAQTIITPSFSRKIVQWKEQAEAIMNPEPDSER